MREKILRLFLIIIFIITWISAFAQETGKKAALGITIIDSLGNSRVIFNDSIKSPEIVLSTSQSVKFLQERFRPQYWNDSRDPFRQALGQILYEASHPPFDSAKIIMKTYPYDSLSIPWDKFYKWEPLRLDIPANEVTDTTIMVVVDTLDKVTSSYPGFPFRYFSFPIRPTPLRLLSYLY